MPGEPQNPAIVACRTRDGRILAHLRIWATTEAGSTGEAHPIIRLPEAEAIGLGEEPIQLRERCRYVYRLEPLDGDHELAVQEGRGIKRSPASLLEADEGFIEPGDYCGVLTLVITRRGDHAPLARAAVEVRSVKLDYRDHYRGMLTHIASKCAGLLLDSRAPTHLRLSSEWRTSRSTLEQQLEFLRHTLESSRFRGAIDEVLRSPHRRLEDDEMVRSVNQAFRANAAFARQLSRSGDRLVVPPLHPLRLAQPQLTSLPARVVVPVRTDFLDTPENRFAKMVIVEFRDFLAEVDVMVRRDDGVLAKPENTRLLNDVTRLRGLLESQLGRGFLPDVSKPEMLPLGSPALQHKSGYRELLQMWLEFHVGAQLAWGGGEEVWTGGARNVATLYEYWLFFQIDHWFREKFSCDSPLHSIVVGNEGGLPRLMLQRGVELRAPIAGVWSQQSGRRLCAEFHFNRKFSRRQDDDHTRAGSWTRGLQPDYTISIWPADYSADEAEQNELMVHVHFDAKYRVERARELLGDAADDEGFRLTSEPMGMAGSAAKYADLLKMHAYRDAIRRTAGAYVLYPGNPGDTQSYSGFHEILPGLGAFAIRPGEGGKAEGMGDFSTFMDEVIDHLSNRTTARERANYHLSESYFLRESPVTYGALPLAESDVFASEYRALPPAEDMALLAWYRSEAQLELARDPKGFYYVRLGRRAGALHVHPNLSRVRQILLRTDDGVVASGLLRLRESGFRIFTRTQLRAELRAHAKGAGVAAWESSAAADDEQSIYALFRTVADLAWAGQQWRGEHLMRLIELFESDRRNALVENIGRTSPYPRALPLRDVLKARR